MRHRHPDGDLCPACEAAAEYIAEGRGYTERDLDRGADRDQNRWETAFWERG